MAGNGGEQTPASTAPVTAGQQTSPEALAAALSAATATVDRTGTSDPSELLGPTAPTTRAHHQLGSLPFVLPQRPAGYARGVPSIPRGTPSVPTSWPLPIRPQLRPPLLLAHGDQRGTVSEWPPAILSRSDDTQPGWATGQIAPTATAPTVTGGSQGHVHTAGGPAAGGGLGIGTGTGVGRVLHTTAEQQATYGFCGQDLRTLAGLRYFFQHLGQQDIADALQLFAHQPESVNWFRFFLAAV